MNNEIVYEDLYFLVLKSLLAKLSRKTEKKNVLLRMTQMNCVYPLL